MSWVPFSTSSSSTVDSSLHFFRNQYRRMAVADAAGLVLFLLLGRLTCADHSPRVTLPPLVCPLDSVKDFVFASQNDVCSSAGSEFSHTTAVIEGDEVALQKALNIIHKNEHDCVALLFYSSWCPFSGVLRPSFSVLSSVFPSIPHFALEESALRPSILSKNGVYGFPTLILLNSTMRMRYQGSRTMDSLISFYDEFIASVKNSPWRPSLPPSIYLIFRGTEFGDSKQGKPRADYRHQSSSRAARQSTNLHKCSVVLWPKTT